MLRRQILIQIQTRSCLNKIPLIILGYTTLLKVIHAKYASERYLFLVLSAGRAFALYNTRMSGCRQHAPSSAALTLLR